MERHSDFSSSNIAEIAYDEGSETLEIRFHNGSVYQYFDVPEAMWDGLKNADSKGKYLAANIKGSFRYSKV